MLPDQLQRTQVLPPLQAVVAVVEAACGLVRDLLQSPIHDWQKLDASPVTSIDIAIDRYLNAHLRPLMPAAGWLSEETADNDERLQYRYLWVVDPIDGTRSMMAGHPEFCVSVGLVETGVGSLLGVIANPSTHERFTAVLGQGAHDRDGLPLHVRDVHDPLHPDVLVSRSDLAKGLWQGVLPDKCLTPLGSLAYKMALVAAGAYDGHATPTPRSEWDAAAGALILAEAGGISTDLHGQPLRFNQLQPSYDGMVVASRGSHARMLELARASARIYASAPWQP
jgi:myo-inositol-1(or 4)-monophosphatase